jgi:uncharacterized RDD family membrane protein YckC
MKKQTISLVYRIKRRRLTALMILVLGLVAAASIWVPRWEPAGPVWAERVAGGLALVTAEDEGRFRISWQAKPDGPWRESEPLEGPVTATLGGDALLVFHGRSFSTFAPAGEREPMRNAGWEQFPHHWTVRAAARSGAETAVFGLLDERTIVAARREGDSVWAQAPELRRGAPVRDLVAAGGADGPCLWWREDGRVRSALLGPEGWTSPAPVEAPADARLAAAAVAGAPTLFVVADPRKPELPVALVPRDGPSRRILLENPFPILRAIDSVSAPDGDAPELAAASGYAVGLARLDGEPALADVSHTLFRYRPGAYPWFVSMVFASLGIVGIGTTLLFERRRVTEDILATQARMLSAVAPLALRALAASVDTLPFLYAAAWFVENGTLAPVSSWLASVALCCAYHAVAELAWARTLGKRIAGLAVLRTDGAPAEPRRILLRNLVRALEMTVILLPAVLMISTKRTQRLGDLVSGTMVGKVVEEPKPEEEEA